LEEGANILEQNFQLAYSGLDTLTSLDEMYAPNRQFYYNRLVEQKRLEQIEANKNSKKG
jgi:hypothetical protein